MENLFLQLYTKLIRLRLVEEQIAKEYGAQEMRCPVHLCLGQEAVAIAAGHALSPSDTLFSTHRSHGPYVASGASIDEMILEFYGKEGGCCNGRGGSMHLMDKQSNFLGSVPIVGSSLALATGAAFAHAMKKNNMVSMVIFGEGATEEGVFYESLQFAVLKKLPIVYVCENNGFSVNTPYEQRRPKHIKVHDLVEAQGVKIFTSCGSNVFTNYELCKQAVNLARSGNGPVFLEFETYRYMEHCGPYDDHYMPHRLKEDLELWKSKDPLVVAKKILVDKGFKIDALNNIAKNEEELILQAFIKAKQAPFPTQPVAEFVYSD